MTDTQDTRHARDGGGRTGQCGDGGHSEEQRHGAGRDAARPRARQRRASMRGASPHPRRTGPMLASPRCGARTRSGPPCRAPAVRGKCRCRMHGGARGSGAPRGNRNAFRHVLYTRAAIADRRALAGLFRDGERLLAQLGEQAGEKPTGPP